MKSKVRKVTLALLIATTSLAVMGCTVGLKTRNNLVMHDPIPFPENAKGAARIATNEKIPIVVEGKVNLKFEKDVGGYVVVTPLWYAELVRNWNKHRDGE
jgi:hypothetical protein